MSDVLIFIGMALLFVAFLAVGPWLLIWSVNTLFGTSIVLGFKTWLAGFVLLVLLGRGS